METVEEVLEHFGVKGMQWGVRKARGPGSAHQRRTDAINANRGKGGGRQAAVRISHVVGTSKVNRRADRAAASSARRLNKAQSRWEKKAGSPKVFLKSYNAAAGRMNSREIGRINNKPQYKNADFTLAKNAKLNRTYLKEMNDTFAKVMSEEASKIVGSSPTGTKIQFTPIRDAAGNHTGGIAAVFIDQAKAKHDDMGNGIACHVKTDTRGHILGITFSESAMAQAVSKGEAFLEHFGVKGMRWGVRRRGISSSSKSVKTRGGTISEDAAKAHESHKTVQTHRTTDPLSNKELQHLVNRINLEQQYVRLTTKQSIVKRGRSFAKDFIDTGKTFNEADKLTGGHLAKAFAGQAAKMKAKGG